MIYYYVEAGECSKSDAVYSYEHLVIQERCPSQSWSILSDNSNKFMGEKEGKTKVQRADSGYFNTLTVQKVKFV